MGLDLDEPRSLAAVEARARELVEAAAGRDWAVVPADSPTVAWICDWLVPNLARTTDEIDNLLVGLAGGHVPAGPSGTLTRGGAHVLPTGRNFYSVDPKSLPTRLAWDCGVRLSDGVVARHMAMKHHRGCGHRAEILQGGGPLWFDLEERQIAGVPAPPSPEDRLIEAEAQSETATEVDLAALSRATKPARWRAFYAHVVQGVPVARIAATERAHAPTIYTRIRRAREELRAAIARQRAARRRR